MIFAARSMVAARSTVAARTAVAPHTRCLLRLQDMGIVAARTVLVRIGGGLLQKKLCCWFKLSWRVWMGVCLGREKNWFVKFMHQ